MQPEPGPNSLTRLIDAPGVPPRDKLELARELQGDYRALKHDLIAQGLTVPEAERRALARVWPDAAAADALGEIHRSDLARRAATIGPLGFDRFERWTLVGVTSGSLFASGVVLFRLGAGLRSPILPVLLLCMIALMAQCAHLIAAGCVRFDLRRDQLAGEAVLLSGLVILVLSLAGAGGALELRASLDPSVARISGAALFLSLGTCSATAALLAAAVAAPRVIQLRQAAEELESLMRIHPEEERDG